MGAITSVMANPRPTLRKVGSSTRSMYQQKLFRTWATIKAKNGGDVMMDFHGTGLLGFVFP